MYSNSIHSNFTRTLVIFDVIQSLFNPSEKILQDLGSSFIIYCAYNIG